MYLQQLCIKSSREKETPVSTRDQCVTVCVHQKHQNDQVAEVIEEDSPGIH